MTHRTTRCHSPARCASEYTHARSHARARTHTLAHTHTHTRTHRITRACGVRRSRVTFVRHASQSAFSRWLPSAAGAVRRGRAAGRHARDGVRVEPSRLQDGLQVLRDGHDGHEGTPYRALRCRFVDHRVSHLIASHLISFYLSLNLAYPLCDLRSSETETRAHVCAPVRMRTRSELPACQGPQRCGTC